MPKMVDQAEFFRSLLAEPSARLLVINIFISIIFVAMTAHRYAASLLKRAELLGAARESTKKFYAGADELMRSADLPEVLKNTLYDLILAVTHERFGQVAVGALLADDKPSSEKHNLAAALEILRRERPDLANQFFDVVRAAFSSLLLSFGHSEHRTLLTITQNATQQKELVKTAERVEYQFNTSFPQPGFACAA